MATVAVVWTGIGSRRGFLERHRPHRQHRHCYNHIKDHGHDSDDHEEYWEQSGVNNEVRRFQCTSAED